MGMDYVWSGSASYPRFNQELEEVAKIFGARKTFLSDKPRFEFPESFSYQLAEWFQNPYEYYSPQQTKIIWEAVRQHPEIKEISWQIWNELEKCVEFEDGWYIY